MRIALRCEGLSKIFGRQPRSVLAVDRVDLQVPVGCCFGLLGPNGAGKTTTVEILEGIQQPTSGSVEVFGLAWAGHRRSLRQRMGISLQEARLPDKLTAVETIQLFRGFYRRPLSAKDSLSQVGLESVASRRVAALSGGQKQRLAVACALVGDPELLFLDEPTSGLDPASRRQIWEVVRSSTQSGRTVLLTTHSMEEATRLCDVVAIMHRGKVLVQGPPAELIAAHSQGQWLSFSLLSEETSSGGDHLGGPPDPDRLAQLPGVDSATLHDDHYRLLCTDLSQALPSLLELLRSCPVELRNVRTEAATLEDVFLALTGDALPVRDWQP